MTEKIIHKQLETRLFKSNNYIIIAQFDEVKQYGCDIRISIDNIPSLILRLRELYKEVK